jgi:hypothetical protein
MKRKLTPIDVAVPETREWIYKKLKDYQIIKNQKAPKSPKPAKLSQKQLIQLNQPNPFEKTTPVSIPVSSQSIEPISK